MSKVTVVMMLGLEGESPVERFVADGRGAAARDALATLVSLPMVERAIVATSDAEWAERNADLGFTLDLDRPGEPFHFGHRLRAVCQRYGLERILYFGGGSLPLLSRERLAETLEEVAQAGGAMAVTNNLYSSDWIALSSTQALVQLPHRLVKDNALGWVMKTEAGLTVRSLPPAASSRVDIDTPFDLLLLSLYPGLGGTLADYLRNAVTPQQTARLRATLDVLSKPGSQAAIIGRVASSAWAALEAQTQVWLRVYSEERGMAASGRQAAGLARSLVAAHLEAVGETRFFEELAGMAGAVIVDTRVLLAHRKVWPASADRYASDLGRWEEIDEPFLRRFTQAAVAAPVPVVLGGHGCVSGGLYAMADILRARGVSK